ncbi:hypothetical protein KC921_01410 [Candidatus Woesebacteria bacterium]|nr:hypothetical protein [Candidatus Woesebacteria bacterium]
MKLPQLGMVFYANAQTKTALLSSLVLTVFTTAASIIYLPSAQPVLPLFYTFTRPEQTLVNKWWLLLIPGCSLLFSLFAHTFQLVLRTVDVFVLQLFAWFTVFVQIVLLLAIVRIIGITL